MNDERYSIIYSSRTGNTRLLAEAIRESLPADLCNHFGTDEAGAVEGAGSGKGEHRREQFDHRHLYVPGKNAHGGPGAV